MNSEEALHTAARRYCMDRISMWHNRYAKLASAGQDREGVIGKYTPEALATFPRYNVLEAILAEIERSVPSDFRSMDEIRDRFLLAGQTAESMFTQPPNEQIALRVMSEERQLFCDYVRGLTSGDLRSVQPLPYQRVLSESESEGLRAKLKGRWRACDGYWHPLSLEDMPPDVIAFQARYFDKEVGAVTFRRILADRGINRVWELREWEPDYEIDLELLDPVHAEVEQYYTSRELDWLVYVSHESSITFAGAWLIKAVQDAWPNWEQRLYTGWDYE